MSAPDPADIWEEILAWLRVAETDQRVVMVCLASNPPVLGAAAFHCQQAAEKLLKGFLVHASIDFGKTHDLERLGRIVASHFPSVASLVAAVEGWTSWSIAYRYPDLADPDPVPSADELSQALQSIARLADALKTLGPPAQKP
jgi:HEPN domain-containing protein